MLNILPVAMTAALLDPAAFAAPPAPVEGVIHFRGQLVLDQCMPSAAQLDDLAQGRKPRQAPGERLCAGVAEGAGVQSRVVRLAQGTARVLVITYE